MLLRAIALCLCAVTIAHADQGSNWLLSQSKSDGSIAIPSDISTPFQSTAESLRTLALLGLNNGSQATAIQQYLSTQNYFNTENLSRLIIAGLSSGQDVSGALGALLQNQDATSGGFGELPGYQPSVLDTAFALEALGTASAPNSAAIARAIGFLQQQQNSDGSWQDGDNAPSVYLTSLATNGLRYYAASYNISQTQQKASAFLLSARGSDGLWGEDFLSAESLIALLQTQVDLTPIQTSVQSLQSHQLADGSWGGDVFTTALALRTLAIAQQRSTTGSGSGALQGYVRLAGSNQPVVGAAVSVPSVPGLTVQTNASGYFIVSGLQPGNATVVASKSGFGSSSAAAQVVSGQTTTVNGLVLSASGQTGTITVHLFDSSSGSAISGASLALTGAGSYNATTDSNGNAEFDGAIPGSYTIAIQASGYPNLQGTFTLNGGQTLNLNQPMSTTASNGSSPVNVVATIVDGTSSAPIANAALNFGGGHFASSDSSGQITVMSVPPGSYTATLSASGYATQNYSVVVTGGSNNNLGQLKLYQSNGSTTANTVTLIGTVLDGLNNKPVSGAAVSIPNTSLSAVSDASGHFTISGITTLSFPVTILATGYSAQNFTVNASAYGSVAVNFLMPPQAGSGTTTNLQGTITDSSNNSAISGATLSVSGSSITATSDSSGHYVLANLPSTQFSLQIAALNYITQNLDINLTSPGTYNLDAALDPSGQSSTFQILSLTTNDSGKGANQVQVFQAKIGNTSTDSQQGVIIGHILRSDGTEVSRVSPWAVGTQTMQSNFSFAPQEVKTLQIPWNPMQLAPAAYTLRLDVVKPGTITTSTPNGTTLAERSAFTSVSQTTAFVGTLAFDPPLSQTGSTAPVQLKVLVVNSGNVPLSATPVALTVTSSDHATVLFTASATTPLLAVGSFEYVDFGQWIPTANGNLNVVVSPQSAGVQGQVTGTLYVGDKPQGAYTVSPSTVFTGDQTVHGTINVTGVDTHVGVSSPLALAINQAVSGGSQYVSANAILDTESSRCLRCHVQTQSYFGLASLTNHDIGSNQSATQYLYNSLSSSQQNDGSLMNSYYMYAETETALGLWALTQSPDKLDSFSVKYKAALFMGGRSSVSGNRTWWNSDYPYGWWPSIDANNMLATKGFVDLLVTAQNNDLTSLKDYQLPSNSLATGLGNTSALKLGPDGALYTVMYSAKSIARIDSTTGARTTVASGLPGTCTSLFVVGPTEFYVACLNQLIHVLPDGSKQAVGAIGARAGDIAVAGDGSFYISDPSNNRILQGPSGGPFTPYVSSGLLNSPLGLEIDSDGTLYVANTGGYNILKVTPDKTVSVLSAGLIYPPEWIARTSDGTMFVSHAASSQPYQTTYEGLLLIKPTGEAKGLFTLQGLNGVSVQNEQIFIVATDGTLRQVVVKPLDTSQLTQLLTRLNGVVQYTLNEYYDGNVDNIQHAMRLTSLGEARRVITDPSLLNQINTAINTIDSLLRSRQRPDGGWGYYNGGASDPMVTALVGLALEYQAPAFDDAVVQKTVQYLLNSQNADKSWTSTNNILTTRLASTSLVMSYLPKILDRLVGLSVDLHLNFPYNIQLLNPSQTPDSNLPTGDGGTAYIFKLPGVTSQGRTVSFDLSLANMQQGENRSASSAAYLLSTNSYNNSQVRVDLDIPKIHATDGLSLVTLQTDKPTYTANQTAQLSADVTNIAPAAVSGTVTFVIKSTADQSIVAQLPAVPFSNLAPGQTITVNTAWPVGTTQAGQYVVVADLADASGATADEKTTNLAILAGDGTGTSTPSVSLRVTTDRQTYTTTDSVNLGDLVKNLTVNAPVNNASLQIQVVDPNGVVVYTKTISLGQMAPGAVRQFSNAYALHAAPQGAYAVNGWVLDGTGSVLASGSATFNVVENLAQTVTGTVTTQTPWVYQGDPETCTDVVTNKGTQSISNLSIHQVIVNLDTGVLDQEAYVTAATLSPGASKTYTRVFTTNGMPQGHHACAIEAQINGAYKPLANAVFEVRQPPVRVTGNLGLGDKGRLLVLMDSPTDHSSGGELCNSGLGDVSFEIDLDKALSPEAIVEVKLLNALGLIVDSETTSLRSYTGEVNAQSGSQGIDLSIPSLTTDSLVVTLAGSGAGHLLNGTYKLMAVVTDPVQNLTFNSGLFSLTCNAVGAIGDTVGKVFRVIGINNKVHTGTGIGDGKDSIGAAQQKSYLQSLLDQDGWSYLISTDKDDFASQMRGGGFQNFALLSEYQVLDDQIQRELRESIFAGDGLINAGRHDVRRRILDNPLGIEYRGTQLSPTAAQMLTGNVFSLSGQSSFTQNNQVQRVVLEGASVDGKVLSTNANVQDTLITHYGYGNGRSTFGGYDLLAEASASNSTSGLFASLIRKPLIYINPSQSTPVAGRVVPVRLSVTNTGIANTTLAKVSASLGSYVVSANGGTVSNGKLTWSFNLAVNETKTIDLWMQLPSGGVPATLTAVLTASTSTFTANPVTVTYAINPVTKPGLDQAITDLTDYVSHQPAPGLLSRIIDPILGIKTPTARALELLKAANQDLTNGKVQRALAEQVQATDLLINDGSAVLKPIRLEIDESIYQTQKLQ